MSETSLEVREPTKLDADGFRDIAPKEQLASIVQQIVEKDPEAARRFLVALRHGTTLYRRRPMLDTLRSIGSMADLVCEAMRPTPLRQHPASLADAWAAVGSYIEHGIHQMGRRLDARG